MNFDFTITKYETHAIISLSGELIEKSQAIQLLEKTEGLVKEGFTKLAIDLGQLKYMNSSGLNTLIQLLTKARIGGGEVVLYNMAKKINELILITKLHTLFKVAVTEEEALKLLEI